MKVVQSCLTLCDPMDITIHGVLQARILEWVDVPSPEDLPNPGIEPNSPTLKADSLPAEPQGKPLHCVHHKIHARQFAASKTYLLKEVHIMNF